MNRRLYAVYGAAGAGRGIMPLMRAQFAHDQSAEFLFVDDGQGVDTVNGHRCVNFEDFVSEPAHQRAIAIAVADPAVRRKLAQRCAREAIRFLSISAQQHVRMDDTEIGEGALFSPFTSVTSNVRIGRHFHCNIGSHVEHDCVIGDFVTFAPGVQCNGNVHIGDGAYIGSGAMLRQGRPGQPLRIGAGAVVGMGAVVLQDVAPGETVAGNPARPLKR